MSGYQIIEATAGSTDWATTSTIMNFAMKGFLGVSLSNWESTGVPAINAGSRLEVAGAMYYFASTESITGSVNTSAMNYIMVTTSSSSITASFTTSPPTWVPSKNGWYDSSTGSKRYVGGTGKNRHMKWLYDKGIDNLQKKVLEIGDWDMDADGSKTITHGLFSTTIRSVEVIIRDDDSSQFWDLRQGSGPNFDGDFLMTWFIVSMNRIGADNFDTTDYDSTGFNRGWVTIDYEV